MKNKFAAVRVPKSVGRSVRARLRNLLDYLAWSTLEPVDDVPKIASQLAAIAGKIATGVRMEIVEDIRVRADKLKQSDDKDDLIASAELEDLLEDLSAKLGMVGDDEKETQIGK